MSDSYIEFIPLASNPKTLRWQVVNRFMSDYALGEIKWFGRWRCYSFLPVQNSVFDEKCLREIADFCGEQTRLHKKNKIAL